MIVFTVFIYFFLFQNKWRDLACRTTVNSFFCFKHVDIFYFYFSKFLKRTKKKIPRLVNKNTCTHLFVSVLSGSFSRTSAGFSSGAFSDSRTVFAWKSNADVLNTFTLELIMQIIFSHAIRCFEKASETQMWIRKITNKNVICFVYSKYIEKFQWFCDHFIKFDYIKASVVWFKCNLLPFCCRSNTKNIFQIK